MWGLYDTVDNTWIGNENGPHTYDEQFLARVAARVFDVMVGQEPGRTRDVEFTPGSYRYKEKLKASMTTLEALQALEAGKVP